MRGLPNAGPLRALHAAAHRAAGRPVPIWALIAVSLIAVAGLYIVVQQQGRLLGHQSHSSCAYRLQQAGLHPGSSSGYTQQRQRIYDAMAESLRAGPLALGGTITQGLTQADLFSFSPDPTSGHQRPVPRLRALQVPVRAVVLPFSQPQVAARLHAAVQAHLAPVVPPGLLWPQNHSLYHATLVHASSHAAPVAASPEDIQLEAEAVRVVATATCPIRAVLDRVVATSTGVVLACWQVLPGGGEPAQLRAALQATLPNPPPPQAQAVRQPAILHTTLARLLAAPAASTAAGARGVEAAAVEAAARHMTQDLCGMVADLQQVMFVQEHHLLALALNGRVSNVVSAAMLCREPGLVAV